MVQVGMIIHFLILSPPLLATLHRQLLPATSPSRSAAWQPPCLLPSSGRRGGTGSPTAALTRAGCPDAGPECWHTLDDLTFASMCSTGQGPGGLEWLSGSPSSTSDSGCTWQVSHSVSAVARNLLHQHQHAQQDEQEVTEPRAECGDVGSRLHMRCTTSGST